MFIGHYSVALALRPLKASPSLPVLFTAVQAIDIAFFSLLIPRIEQMRITPGITAMNSMDLYYLPYTHSILGAALFGLAFAALLTPFMPRGKRTWAFAIAAFAVFSHWLLDYLVHRPDLGIIGDSAQKLGLGLWNYPNIAMPLEIALTVLGLAIYLAATKARSWAGTAIFAGMIAAMAGLQYYNWFGPQPPFDADLNEVALMGLLAYAIFIALAWALERFRTVRPVSG